MLTSLRLVYIYCIYINPEFYADFRYEGIIQKNLPKKDNPKKLSQEKMVFFGSNVFQYVFYE